MTASLVVSSCSVKDSRSVIALILTLLIAFVITLRGEQATEGRIVIEGRSLALRSTMRAVGGWDSARFQALLVACSWFRQNGVISFLPKPLALTVRRVGLTTKIL
jgi:hypothetical protein